MARGWTRRQGSEEVLDALQKSCIDLAHDLDQHFASQIHRGASFAYTNEEGL